MQAYLDWEYGLVEQLRRDATHGFFVRSHMADSTARSAMQRILVIAKSDRSNG
jgi:hypothetical protein